MLITLPNGKHKRVNTPGRRLHRTVDTTLTIADSMLMSADMAAEIDKVMKSTVRNMESDAASNLAKNDSVRTGALQRAIKSKGGIKQHKGRQMDMFLTVGYSVGIEKGVFATAPAKKNRTNPRLIKPYLYAHLVEYGHVSKEGKHIAAKPFMRPAVAAYSVSLQDKVAEAAKKGASNALG